MVVVSYLGEQIEAFMQQQEIVSDYRIVPQPIGTGHALMCCREFLQSDTFLVINGDDLYDRASLQALAGTELGIMTAERSDPWRWGVVITDEEGFVKRVHEKPLLNPSPALINTGAYKFDLSVFNIQLVPSTRGEYEITDYVSELAFRRRVSPIPAAFWASIGIPDDYAAAQKLNLERLLFG